MRTVKYYYREHLAGYQRMKREGKGSWGEIHGNPDGFSKFASRPFLEAIVLRLRFRCGHPEALELGCGSGAGACFLAERGFQVTGIDLIPMAIEAAREIATERGLDVYYEVMDVTRLPHDGPCYDLIVDPQSETVFHRYDDDDLFDPEREILYALLPCLGLDDVPGAYEEAEKVTDHCYLPKRRYRTPESLKVELEGAGFRVLLQTGSLGENAICVLASSSAVLD